MKSLLIALVAIALCGPLSAQSKKLCDIDLAHHDQTYRLSVIPSQYTPTARFDYEFTTECPAEYDEIAIRVQYFRVDKMRAALDRSIEKFKQMNYTDTKAPAVVRNFPKVDVYFYEDGTWVIKPGLRLTAEIRQVDDHNVMILETSEFHYGSQQDKCSARLVFTSPEEVYEFRSGFEEEMVADLREDLKERRKQHRKIH